MASHLHVLFPKISKIPTKGVNMNKFLTVNRIEALYNSRNGPANTLNYIVRDVVPRMPKGYRYTLIDIGKTILLLKITIMYTSITLI